MDKQILQLINGQINFEFFSSYLYLGFANYYAEADLDGFENWFHIQAKEELDHAMLLIQYLHNNDQKVVLEQIRKPDLKLTSHAQPLKIAYEHEKQVTVRFNRIYEAAFKKKDFRTTQLLEWFIMEQGEEEKAASDLMAKMNLFGNDSKGLYELNKEFAARVYAAPSLVL